VEIEVGSLAINTILQADYLREFEDALELSGVDSKKKAKDNAQAEFDTDLDEFVTCRAAFQKLKDLMNRWLQDIHNEDEYADDLMSNVYRWLSSGIASKMYDPLLHRLVHKLMKKNFFQLLHHLK
jgi:DNA polymerase epsilon subunit 1